MINVTQFIKENDLGKYRFSGDQVELGCPFDSCPNQGQPQFYINKNTGSWFCHRCNKKGSNLKQLLFGLGKIKLSTSSDNEEGSIVIPEKDINQWVDDLFNDAEAVNYLTNTRCLETWVVKQFRLGMKQYNKEKVIVIPYFDQQGVCVGAKYDRFTSAEKPKYIKEKGSKSLFYNIDNVTLNEPLTITEGEYDTISAFQYGIENVGSIPNGATAINGWVDDLQAGSKFNICTDYDEAGKESAQRLSKVLGITRCYRVATRTKDLSEALQIGVSKEEVNNWFSNAKPMFNPPVMDLSAYKDEAVTLINDPLALRGVSTGWKEVDEYLGGLRMKEVSVVSGETGNGKSTFGIALINNLVAEGMKCLVVSPEMAGGDLLRTLSNSRLKKQVTSSELETVLPTLKSNVQLANFYGSWSDNKKISEYVFDLMDYSVKTFGTNFIMLDHLDCFMGIQKKNERLAEEEDFIKRCVQFATITDTHIYLVVQPRKPERGQRKISYHDIKGSGLITQITHNILLIHREKDSPVVEFELAKNRRFGKIGSFNLKFDTDSMANYLEVKGGKK